MWPELKSKDLETVGIGDRESASDVVLSSAGKYIYLFFFLILKIQSGVNR